MNSYSQTTTHKKNTTTNPSSHLSGDDAFPWPADAALIPTPRIRAVVLHERCGLGNDIMADVLFKLTVNQLATSIRMQGVDEESNFMLGMLESLVIAGEIEFSDFMRRIQNLFPHLMDKIDRALLAKLLAYVG